MKASSGISCAFNRERGVTLVELMIAILIGLFLVGGLLTLTGAMKRTGGIQGNLDQLHDGERLALTIMTDVIQEAGFFPLTTANVASPTSTAVLQFPATGVWQAGQTVYGTDGGTADAPLDTVSVRYLTAGNDGVLNCTGATSAVAATWINTFQVDGQGDLQCVLTTGATPAPPVNLVNGVNAGGANVAGVLYGVQYMGILYGVQSNAASGTTSVDTYLTATQVSASNLWNSVISMQVTLYFGNPLFGQPGQSKSTIQVTRVIDLMNKAT
jgi:type IV pilus assembly protein PilW